MKKRTLIFLATMVSLVLTACSGTFSVADGNANINLDQKNSSSTETSSSLPTYELPDDPFAVAMSPNLDYLTVVNPQNHYVWNGTYDQVLQQQLVKVPDVLYHEETRVEAGTLYAFSLLQDALEEKGIHIGIFSGHRTFEEQQEVYDYYGSLEGWAENNRVSEPGYSEHHTGLLLNILIYWPDENGNEKIWYTETPERQKNFPEFKIIHETLADYGFIDRYPAGKEDITGYPSEPYEIRFVGSSKIAHEIMDHNLCLEEYLAK
ncbi:M15 family metallopeptidase [Candidatus Saccharibacteria bacterium]|nr:M15 family metallopeptidase [Candidatus Saccharibacteria bacterium]